ncbi:hypothetical protein PHLCEN_2v12206 [Hermanssonia centrifuga]|uniref:Uncharacterized protein n=1 Tax=Hermanssonia centrifuga TaxID=98765 RepID=A0A2R6NHX8_9APHY|nr:hypothetical protein PHLCEN_2v12206 [Hermanssonia centrifuga]
MPKPKRDVPSHRVFEPGKRHMELIASVSRSSGLEKDGDALRNFKLQEKYREFIQEKVSFGLHVNHSWTLFMIFSGKLREGILSTKRNDAFALEGRRLSPPSPGGDSTD